MFWKDSFCYSADTLCHLSKSFLKFFRKYLKILLKFQWDRFIMSIHKAADPDRAAL